MKRLLCWLLDHKWSPPMLDGPRGIGPALYSSICRRCEVRITGDWDDMEAAGAWQHLRSPF